jgi:hypothetical protein
VTNPYKNLPDFQFWKRAVASIEPHLIDPVVAPKFQITRQNRVATAGSCFAQHISRKLSSIGFNFFVSEAGSRCSADEQIRRNFSVFSARYGNIYTVRQLLQLFQEAFGAREKSEEPWKRDDERFVDPFRPTIEPEGYVNPNDVLDARMEHLAYVRQVFLESEIFVFTLGLTEGWLSISSGDVFPLAPGVSGGAFDSSSHGFINFSVEEVISDLKLFLAELKSVNSSIRVLLTVSPVPLVATFEQRHVLVSTTFSKSVLRVAAGVVAKNHDWVDYFPSYEIITSNFSMGRYFEEDLREINKTGVNHVMKCFLSNYIQGVKSKDKERDSNALLGGKTSPAEAEFSKLSSVICDEEAIDRVSF